MIGIFGGTFDPIHLGHLRMALELAENLVLEEVRFVPCKQPVHKKAASAAAEHRVAMLKSAIQNQPQFVVDEREVRRRTPSYMIDTLIDINRECPKSTLGLIIGSDALLQFTTWKQWQDILTLAKLLVVPRQGFDFTAIPTEIRPHTQMCPITTLPISSTNIRAVIKSGQSPRYWVPDSVWDYINHHQLYR